MTTSVDRAREMLGGGINGRDIRGGHADRSGLTLVTSPRRAWSWRRPEAQREPKAPAKRDGTRLIATSAGLLFLLGAGLLAVSVAAQYAYFLHERHQITASAIEAGALDAGMIIFCLLALGVARKGLHARAERALIVACAAASAVMNYANADTSSWRSVLAWTMPPVFLAVVADRVIAITRRHFLGMGDGRSAWRDAASTTGKAARALAFLALYSLRFVLAPPSTAKGVRQAVLNATPLPQAPEHPAIEAPAPPDLDAPDRWYREHCLTPVGGPGAGAICGQLLPCPDHPRRRRERSGGSGTKTARFLDLVKERRGDLAGIPLDQVSRIATEIAPEADLHPASARTALLAAVRKALPAGEGDGK